MPMFVFVVTLETVAQENTPWLPSDLKVATIPVPRAFIFT